MMMLNVIKIIRITRTIVTAIAQDNTNRKPSCHKLNELINLRKHDLDSGKVNNTLVQRKQIV